MVYRWQTQTILNHGCSSLHLCKQEVIIMPSSLQKQSNPEIMNGITDFLAVFLGYFCRNIGPLNFEIVPKCTQHILSNWCMGKLRTVALNSKQHFQYSRPLLRYHSLQLVLNQLASYLSGTGHLMGYELLLSQSHLGFHCLWKQSIYV